MHLFLPFISILATDYILANHCSLENTNLLSFLPSILAAKKHLLVRVANLAAQHGSGAHETFAVMELHVDGRWPCTLD